jgi:hypothetical protein
MNSPEETQLSDDLHQIVAGHPFDPDVEAIERRGQRQRRRSFALRGLAGLTVLGVAVVGSLAAVNHTGTTNRVASHPATRTAVVKPAAKVASPVKAETVAYVEKQIAAAASGLNNYLVKSRQNTSGTPSSGEITIWTDPRTGNTMLLQGSGASRVAYWEHDFYDSHRVLNWDETQVNYGPSTWWHQDQTAGGPIQGPVPKGPVGGDYDTPAQVGQWLTQGIGKIIGHPYVDGHHTVELSISAGPAKTYVLFADTRTYQVVRTIDYFNQVPGGAPITANYTWVRRSSALVKLVNHPVIPVGYTQVAPGY